MNRFGLIVFCLSFVFQITDLSFIEEYIDFEFSDQKFYVNGIYIIRNESGQNIQKQLFYPFPVDSVFIDSIFITDNKIGRIQFDKFDKGVSFIIELMPEETAILNIGYQQKVISDTVVYILTTTQVWESPLKKAVYSFIIDRSTNIKEFSYKPDTVFSKFSKNIFRWEKLNFLPERDFSIVFE